MQEKLGSSASIILNWDTHPLTLLAQDKLEYSAVGFGRGMGGWFFSKLCRESEKLGAGRGTGYYFLHVTSDFGKNMEGSVHGQFADQGERSSGKRLEVRGAEVTSVQDLSFTRKIRASDTRPVADLGGLMTEDGGETWRITKAKYNTNYDYAL